MEFIGLSENLGVAGCAWVYLAEGYPAPPASGSEGAGPAYCCRPQAKRAIAVGSKDCGLPVHPAIATVYALEESEGHLYIASEYVEGENLRSELPARPAFADALLDLAIEVVQGLVAAHAEGVIHRDLKPENIMRNKKGQLKILDFGLAHCSGNGLARRTLD